MLRSAYMLDKTKLILIAIIMAIPVIFLIWLAAANPFAKPATRIDLSRTSVIKEIQSLGNLETASYSIEKIVEAGKDGNVFQNLLYGDKILLIAHGKVIAGVNLTSVKEEDIKVSGENLTINLPAPMILSSTLDNSKTTVYDRTQGFLSR